MQDPYLQPGTSDSNDYFDLPDAGEDENEPELCVNDSRLGFRYVLVDKLHNKESGSAYTVAMIAMPDILTRAGIYPCLLFALLLQ